MHTARSIYTSYCKRFARKIGVHDALAGLYWRLHFARHPGTITHEVDGTAVRFRITTPAEFRRFRSLREERPVLADLLGSLRPDDVVFDVGANVGTYTCFLASRLPADRVVAFEPHPANLAALRANLDRNDVDATAVEVALSDGTGTGELAVETHDAGAGEHALAADGWGRDRNDPDAGDGSGVVGRSGPTETMEIPLAAGDDLVAAGRVPAPTVLKVDVEGAEGRVLEGLGEALESGPVRLAYVEVHPDRLGSYGDDPEGVRSALADRGFEVERIGDRGTEHFLRATRS